MTENVRKRRSKWDLMAEPNISTESRQESALPEKAGETCHDMLNSEWISQFSNCPDMDAINSKIPKDVSESYPISKCSKFELDIADASKDCFEKSHLPKWSDLKADKKEDPKRSNWDAIPGNETADEDSGWGKPLVQSSDMMKDDNHDLHSGWRTDPDCRRRKSVSPILDARKKHSLSFSPEKGWSRSRRSRSRSWSRSRSRGRSRSRSRGRSRSRSRSPSRSFRRETKGWDDNNRNRLGGSYAPCRDFSVGRCRRGSQCRYLHEDGGRRDPGKGYNDGTTESRGSRYERSRSSGHDGKDSVLDPMHERDFSGRHDYRGWKNYEVHRNSRSTTVCADFTRGRCHRGSACKYVHHNASSDRGNNDRDRGDLDASFGHHVSRRVTDTPCKFFAEGRCRNGDKCRFSHQDQVQSFAEGRSHDDKSVHSSNTQNRSSWDCPKWDDKAEASLDVFGSQKWSDGNSVDACPRKMEREESEHKYDNLQSQKPVDLKFQLPNEAPQIATPVQEHDATQEQVLAFSTQLMTENVHIQQHSGFKVERLAPDDEGMVSDSSALQEERNLFSKDVTLAPGQSLNQSSEAQYLTPKPPNMPTFNPIGQSQQVVPPAPYNWQSQQQIVYPLPVNGQSQFVNPQIPFNVQSFGQSQPIFASPQFTAQSQLVMPAPPFSGKNQQIIRSSLPTGHNQCITPQPLSHLGSFNPEVQSQQLSSQPPNQGRQTQPSEEEGLLCKEETVETKASPISSDKSTQRVVTSEEVAQLSNLSASLAQIFGNAQQLPELYAALNPVNTNGLVASSTTSNPSLLSPHLPASVSFVQPNQGPWQHDPKPDHMEYVKADISNMPPGFASDPVKPETTCTEASQTPPKTSTPLPVSEGQKDLNLGKGVGLEEEKLDLENQGPKHIETSGNNEAKDVNETGTHQIKKEQLPAHSGDMDEEVRTDGESKKNKDAKAMRNFKFALVEHVKDILKPTWKEGQMTKEAHKTIVKKVVDKVTGALQSANVPQTQEKIDLYLSYSKPKLTKLVQAYVEKYAKI